MTFDGQPAAVLFLTGLLGCGFESTGGSMQSAGPTYDLFDIRIDPPVAGQLHTPGGELSYVLNYLGPLAYPPAITAILTHMETGAALRLRLSSGSPPQSADFNYKEKWGIRDDFLKKVGTFQIQLEASVTATLRGSKPWVVQSNAIVMSVNPTLRVVQVLPADGQPIPYGTAVQIAIEGDGLWDDVDIKAVDSKGAPIANLNATIPFNLGQTSGKLPWTPRTRVLEIIGTHEVRLVATFGEITAQSAPFHLLVTHTIDEVEIFTRDEAGAVRVVGTRMVRLQEVKELVIRVRGTKLAGHEVHLYGGASFMAVADEFEIVQVPKNDDFASGKGTHSYSFTFTSGGIERRDSVDIVRWGIVSCGWQAMDGRALVAGERVNPDTLVVMHAATWGFPDTKTTLQILKDRQAEFTIWERDDGRKTVDLDPANNDDEVDSYDSDIIGDKSTKNWTTEFDEEVGVPIVGDIISVDAELYFEVTIEDQMCASKDMLVPSIAR